jgi:hypothetical protein
MFFLLVGLPLSIVRGFGFGSQHDNRASEVEAEVNTLQSNAEGSKQEVENLQRQVLSQESRRNIEGAISAYVLELAKLKKEVEFIESRSEQIKRMQADNEQTAYAQYLRLRNAVKAPERALDKHQSLANSRQSPLNTLWDETKLGSWEQVWEKGRGLDRNASSSAFPYGPNMEMIRYRLDGEDQNSPDPNHTRSRNQTWRIRVSAPDHGTAAIFVGSSEEFKNDLLRLNHLSAVPVETGAQSAAFKVIWNITQAETQATVLHGDKFYREFVFPRTTYGAHSDLAHQKSFSTMIATVYGFINPAWKNPLDGGTTLPRLPDGVGTPQPVAKPGSEEKNKPSGEKSPGGLDAE